MLTAVAQAAAEHGAANVTVAHVVQQAGVSRRTFYEIFNDIEDCFLAAFDDAVRRAAERARPAYETAGPWRERIRAALTALLELFDEDPFIGRLLIVEAPGAGTEALRRRQRVLARLLPVVEEGRSEAKRDSAPSALAAEGVVGAVVSILHGRLLEGGSEPLTRLANELMSMTVLPYLGAAAARRELARAPGRAPARSRRTAQDPLKELRMRLTYRTVRVLSAVASRPGSSNRAIGDASDIGDQGQISKLLSRLERFGLIENAGASAARGEPNAWALTERGWAVHASLQTSR